MRTGKKGFGIHHFLEIIIQSELLIFGISVGLLFMNVLLNKVDAESGFAEQMQIGISLFPYYLIGLTAFTLIIMNVGIFMSYIHIYLGMGMTRKRVIGMVSLSEGITLMISVIASAVIWNIRTDDIAADGKRLLIVMTASMIVLISIADVLVAFCAKWKYFLIIIFGMLFLAGLVAGFSVGYGVDTAFINNIKDWVLNTENSIWMFFIMALAFAGKILCQNFIIRKTAVSL